MTSRTVTRERVLQLLQYDEHAGHLRWLVDRKAVKRGAIAGCLDADGYVLVTVDQKMYRGHRLIWFIATGAWPKGEIDHINGVRNDNRLCNLRDVSSMVNKQNIRISSRRNLSGYLGVTQVSGRFRSAIRINGVSITLGTFDTAEEAHFQYISAKREHHEGNTL